MVCIGWAGSGCPAAHCSTPPPPVKGAFGVASRWPAATLDCRVPGVIEGSDGFPPPHGQAEGPLTSGAIGAPLHLGQPKCWWGARAGRRSPRRCSSHSSLLFTLLAVVVFAAEISAAKTTTASKVGRAGFRPWFPHPNRTECAPCFSWISSASETCMIRVRVGTPTSADMLTRSAPRADQDIPVRLIVDGLHEGCCGGCFGRHAGPPTSRGEPIAAQDGAGVLAVKGGEPSRRDAAGALDGRGRRRTMSSGAPRNSPTRHRP